MFPQSGGRKPFYPGKFGTSKMGKMGPSKPKSDFGELEEIGAKKAPMPKKPNFMADGGMGGPPAGGPPPDPNAQDPDMGMDPGMEDAPPGDLDPVTLHYCIGLLQHLLDSSAPPDDGMDPNAGGDDMGGGSPDDSQFGGQ